MELITSDRMLEVGRLIKEAIRAFENACNGPRGASAFQLIEILYKYTDLITANFTHSCSKGCHYCCDVKVAVSMPEAEFIEIKTGHRITNRKKQKIGPKNKTTPCIFLKKGECSIYEARPYVCRTFFSVDDVKLCIDGKPHNLVSLCPEGKGGFEYFNHWYQVIVIEQMVFPHKELRVCKDIRQYWPHLKPGTTK